MAHVLHPPLAAPRPAARALAADASVDWLRGRAAFDALAAEWDALAARTDDQLFYRHGFLSLWLDAFAPSGSLEVLVQRRAGRLVAALPLLRRRVRMYGLPARALCSVGNLHSCRVDLLAEDADEAAAAFVAALAGRRDWDLLQLADVPPGGRAHALLPAAAAAGLAGGRWTSIVSPYVALPGDAAALDRRLTGKQRAALRRRRQRLAQRGAVTLQRVSGGAGLGPALEEAFALEASGWKGRHGTAMVQDPHTCRFYTGVAEEAARRDALALWLLRVDGRLVAFQLAVEHRNRCLLLKQGYDEAFRDCGPGQLLMQDVLRDAVGRGLVEMDLLGDDAPAKRVWTGLDRRHAWLYLFRGPWGRLLHGLKMRLAPRLRSLRARLRGA